MTLLPTGTPVTKELLDDPDLLPDGRRFAFWKDETVYTKTYFVDAGNPAASDDGDGSEAHPFRTIARAAASVQPGERVYIRKGRYFETIRDVRGGTDEGHMVFFEGEDGVCLSGALEWKPEFRASEGYRETPVESEEELFSDDADNGISHTGAKVYMGKLPSDGSLYEFGCNPFLIPNLQTLPWVPKRGAVPKVMSPDKSNAGRLNADEHLAKRGLLFADGKRMRQVVRPFELWEDGAVPDGVPGIYWVDDTYKMIHLRMAGDDLPGSHRFELAVKETAFFPDEAGQGYIRFRNLSFEKFSNPVKCPQYGALSSNCGHHFILEDCRFSDMNSLGADLGFISHSHRHEGVRGHHIVRGCTFERCGIGGLSAVPTRGSYLENMLIEHNTFTGCGFHDLALLFESSSIKCHYTLDSLIRFNTITDHIWGGAIWLDKNNANTRVTGNTISGVRHATHGAIFNEATLAPVLIDRNTVENVGMHIDHNGRHTGGRGFYEHECENTLVIENVFRNIEGEGVFFQYIADPAKRRILEPGHRISENRDNVSFGNRIDGCRRAVTLASGRDFCDADEVSGVTADLPFGVLEDGAAYSREELLRRFGFEENGTVRQ